MKLNDIIAIAADLGWQTVVTPYKGNNCFVDFIWITKDGKPFSFSAEWIVDAPELMIEDIEKFHTSFNTERYLAEYLEGISNLNPSRYFELFREIEDLHTRVWVLWFNLNYHLEKEEKWKELPPFTWN
ncbi:MAG: SAM-dependent methyltransferase [Muribaculaceae bacterium]|nr:SAM-dependent methyltransferase [Muribaculaceae bacterium]